MEISEKDITGLADIKRKIQNSSCELLQNAYQNGELTDEYLLRFLIVRDYDIESAFERMKKYHENRVIKYPKFFATIIPSNPLHRYGIEEGGMQLLKHRDPHGRYVLTVRANSKVWASTDEMGADDLPQLMTLFGWECMKNKDALENGFVNIFDAEGFSFSHAKIFRTQNLIKWINIFIKAGPVKLKCIHFVNVHPIFAGILLLAKFLLPKKTSTRIHVHGKPEHGFLNAFMPSEHLPEWLGGDLSDDEATDWEFSKRLLKKETDDYYQNLAKPSLDAIKDS